MGVQNIRLHLLKEHVYKWSNHLNQMNIRSTAQKDKGKFSNLCQWHSHLRIWNNLKARLSMKVSEVNVYLTPTQVCWNLTRREVLLLYPNPLTTVATTIVFIIITKITAASKMSTWFQRKWTCINIPMLARKRAAKKLRMGSTWIIANKSKKKHHY